LQQRTVVVVETVELVSHLTELTLEEVVLEVVVLAQVAVMEATVVEMVMVAAQRLVHQILEVEVVVEALTAAEVPVALVFLSFIPFLKYNRGIMQ